MHSVRQSLARETQTIGLLSKEVSEVSYDDDFLVKLSRPLFLAGGFKMRRKSSMQKTIQSSGFSLNQCLEAEVIEDVILEQLEISKKEFINGPR